MGDFGFRTQPVLTNIGETSVEVVVSPSDLAMGRVAYGTDETLGRWADQVVFGQHQVSDRVLRFTLEDLEPGREYHYRVHLKRVGFGESNGHSQVHEQEEVSSDTFRFRTLNHKNPTASFVCWNDTHENSETLNRLIPTLQETRQEGPIDFIFWNGDVTNDIFREEQIIGQYFSPQGQAYATETPVMFSRGNHDVRGLAARRLPDYVTGPGGRYHYGFRQGPLACLVLDTGEDKPDDHRKYAGLARFDRYREMQAEWLKRVIQEPWFRSAPYRIVFTHIPLIWEAPIPDHWPAIWGEGIRGWVSDDAYNRWHNLLVEAQVQLVISGHTHLPAWFPPNESRPYGQLIGGSPKPERATTIRGEADGDQLVITMRSLDGETLEQLSFKPVI